MKYRLKAMDSTDVYSRSPVRPFRYGYAYDMAHCLYHFNDLSQFYDLHEGDIVADVGAASGWIDGALSVLCDSVTFYVEDIDTDFLNQDQFNRMVNHFYHVRGTPQTNTLNYIIGTKTQTRLPDSTFDKIFIHTAFHEIDKPEKILADIQKKLKSNGILIITDEFSSPHITRSAKGCNTVVRTLDWLVKLASKKGFYLYDRKGPAYAYDNILYFSKDKRQIDAQLNDISDQYDLDIENLEVLAKVDTTTIQNLFHELSGEENKIKAVYPLLDQYLAQLTYECLDLNQNVNAYHISLKAMEMYPKNEEIYAAHAYACEQNGYLDRSLEYYEKAAKMDIDPNDYADDIKRVKESIASK